MFDFPGLVQFLFLFFACVAAVVIYWYFRQPSETLNQEKRALYLLVSLLGLFVVSLLVSVKLSYWKDDYRKVLTVKAEKQRLTIDETGYVEKAYKPLAVSYQHLHTRIESIRQLREHIKQLHDTHPNHRELLKNMLDTFNQEESFQAGLYEKVNLEIRNAILHSKTQDPLYVEERFHQRAQLLHHEIRAANVRLDSKIASIATALEDALEDAQNVLLEKKPNKNGKFRQYLFNARAEQQLFPFIEKHRPDMADATRQIIDEIIKARAKKDTIRDLAQRDEDALKAPLIKTGELWQDAEAKAIKQLGDILYAVEAAYIANQFKMPEFNPDYRNLMRALKTKTDNSLIHIKKTRLQVERSFSSPEYVKNSRNP